MQSYTSYWEPYRGDKDEASPFWRWKRRDYERIFHPIWLMLIG